MADPQKLAFIVNSLQESGESVTDFEAELDKIKDPNILNDIVDSLAEARGFSQRGGVPKATLGRSPQPLKFIEETKTEEEKQLETGRRLVEERGLGRGAAAIRGFGESALIGQQEEIAATVKGGLTDRSVLDVEREEEAVTSALREDFPGTFTVAEILGFATPGGVASRIGRGVQRGVKAAQESPRLVKAVSKLFGNVGDDVVRKQLQGSFLRGAAELGLFEGAKELLESGEVGEALSSGTFGAITGGVGGKLGQKVIKGLQSRINPDQAHKALRLGILLEQTEREGGKAAKQLRETASQMLGNASPEVLRSISRNPERVQELVKRGTITNLEVGEQIKASIKDFRDRLGSRIEKFKTKVRKSKGTTRRTKELKNVLDVAERQLTSTSGASVLGAREASLFNRVRKILAPEKVSDNDLLLTIELIDELQKDAGGNLSRKAVNALNLVRRKAKTRLRKKFPGWDKADSNFVKFLEKSQSFERQIDRNPEQFVNTLFNRGKAAIRRDVLELMLFANRIDPKLGAKARRVAGEVLDIRAAQQVGKAITTPNRVQQQAIMNIVDKYRRRGTNVGIGLGTLIGSKIGGPFVGAPAGAAVGGAAGRTAGEIIGQRVGNIDRVFKLAIKSRSLSKQSKVIANDLKKLNDLGIQPAELLDFIPASAKGAEELSDFLIKEIFPPQNSNDIDNLVNQSIKAAR